MYIYNILSIVYYSPIWFIKSFINVKRNIFRGRIKYIKVGYLPLDIVKIG